jgi:hypothetical protein
MDLAKPRLAQSPLSASIDEAERLILSHEPQYPTAAPGQGVASSERAEVAEAATMVLESPKPPSNSTSGRATIQSRSPAAQPSAVGEDVLAKLRKNREPIAVVGFKLPAKLKDELSAVAQYNGTDMTRIVVEALERLLPGLPHPPYSKK